MASGKLENASINNILCTKYELREEGHPMTGSQSAHFVTGTCKSEGGGVKERIDRGSCMLLPFSFSQSSWLWCCTGLQDLAPMLTFA